MGACPGLALGLVSLRGQCPEVGGCGGSVGSGCHRGGMKAREGLNSTQDRGSELSWHLPCLPRAGRSLSPTVHLAKAPGGWGQGWAAGTPEGPAERRDWVSGVDSSLLSHSWHLRPGNKGLASWPQRPWAGA